MNTNNLFRFEDFLIAILFILIICSCRGTTHQVEIPDIDNEPPTFTITIIGPGIGSKTIRSDERCSVSDGTFPTLWDTTFVQLPTGVEYKFTVTAYDDGGVFRTFIQTRDTTKIDIIDINEVDAVITTSASTPSREVSLITSAGDPRRSMALTGRIIAHTRAREFISIGAYDYGGRAADNNFDAGILTFVVAEDYVPEVFYEGSCP